MSGGVNSRADAYMGEDDAVGHAALVTGYPTRDKTGWKRGYDGLTCAEEKANYGQVHRGVRRVVSDDRR